MQFRFIEYDEKTQRYNLRSFCDIKDYDTMYKTLTFMKDNECLYALEINTEEIADTEGDLYCIKEVSFVCPKFGGELLPHFSVIIESEV